MTQNKGHISEELIKIQSIFKNSDKEVALLRLKKLLIRNPFAKELRIFFQDDKYNITWEDIKRFKDIKLFIGEIPEEFEGFGIIGLSKFRSDFRHLKFDFKQNFPLRDNSVESCHSENILSDLHSNELIVVLNNIYRVLKPGGCFAINYQARAMNNIPSNDKEFWYLDYNLLNKVLCQSKFGSQGKITLPEENNDSSNDLLILQKETNIINPSITILSVNYNTKEWIKMLVEKVREFSDTPYELMIIDNGSTDDSIQYLESQNDLFLIKLSRNIGHGPALDYAFSFIRTEYVIIMDSDAHPIHPNWISDLISPLNNDCLVSGIHHHRNYAHPACMAITLDTYNKYNLSFKSNWPKNGDIATLGTFNWDVGENISMRIREYGKRVNLISLSKRHTDTIVGSEYGGIVYHNFYATRLKFSDQSEFDGLTREKIISNTNKHIIDDSAQLLKKNKNLRLSIIITTCNRIKYLEKVLDSFKLQSVSKDFFQIIIVDDGSYPQAGFYLDDYKNCLDIKYIYHDNKGLSFSRNVGIEYADYEIIAFADDDDIPSPTYVEEHLYSHNEHPEINIAVLGKLEWDKSLNVTPFMDYITRISGDYFSFERLIHNKEYDSWKWWGGLISCKREFILKYNLVFDNNFTFGYEDTDLAIRLINKIKIIYNDCAKSYIIKQICPEEYFRRKYKQGKSLWKLEKKHGKIVTDRYDLQNAESDYEILEKNLDQYKNKILEFEKLFLTISQNEQQQYLNNNKSVRENLYKLYAYCIRAFLLQGYTSTSRDRRIDFRLRSPFARKINLGLHAQTLHRMDGIVAGSEITTKGLKKAFEKYPNVEKVIRYGTGLNQKISSHDLVIIEGWEQDVPDFIKRLKEQNENSVVLFWNLSFLGLEKIKILPVDGFLTNSDEMLNVLEHFAPAKKVLLAADPEELYPVEKVDTYSQDVVYLGMYHPHKSEEILTQMLIEASEFDLAIYGKGWDSHPFLKKFWKGVLGLGEINKLYSSAKIVLGTTEDRQRSAGMINNRAFEAVACGATFISEYFPDLKKTFGDLIYYSKEKGDTKKIISGLLKHELAFKDKEKLVKFIVNKHTYDHRAKSIFEFYKSIVNKRENKDKLNLVIKKDNETPYFSICIPTYNRAKYLRDSILSALNQNYSNFEVIIIDDGSTDNTKEIIKTIASGKIKYILKTHTGAPDTRNRAIEEACGEFIVWLDDDDKLSMNTLEEYSKMLLKYPDVDVLYSDLYLYNEMSNDSKHYKCRDWYNNGSGLIEYISKGSPIPNVGTAVRKKIYNELGSYDLNFNRAHDYEFWSRIAMSEKSCKHVPDVMHFYRIHGNNITGELNNKTDYSYESSVLKKVLVKTGIEKLFPKLNWKDDYQYSSDLAYFELAIRFLQWNSIQDGLYYFQKCIDYRLNKYRYELLLSLIQKNELARLFPKEYSDLQNSLSNLESFKLTPELGQEDLRNIDLETLLSYAEDLINSRDYLKAKRILDLVLERDNGNLSALNNVGLLNIIQNKYAIALDVLEQVLEVDPCNQTAINNLYYLKNIINN